MDEDISMMYIVLFGTISMVAMVGFSSGGIILVGLLVVIVVLAIGNGIISWATQGTVPRKHLDAARVQWLLKDLPDLPEEVEDWDFEIGRQMLAKEEKPDYYEASL